MKTIRDKIKQYYVSRLTVTQDPVEDAKAMVSSIEQLTGIHNVFGDKNRNMTILSLLATLLLAGSFIYVGSFSQLVYLIQVFPDKLETFKAINCLSSTCVPLSKYIFLWTERSRLKTIFELSHHGLRLLPKGSTARDQMFSILQRSRYASWLVVANQTITHITYLLVPLLFTLLGHDRYLPTTPGETYGLSPKYETPFYESTFVLTCFATAFSAVNQTGYIVLFITLLAHELGHFYAIVVTMNEIHEILIRKENSQKNQHEEFVEYHDDRRIGELLIFCVKHHQFIMHYHGRVKDLFKVVFGAHFLMMITVLVTTLQTMNAWDIRNTILTGVTGIMPLLFYCFGGEMLISAGLKMSDAVYNCGWEFMDVKRAKIVLLMLCLSQRPLHLTAADIFIMNRDTFGNVAQVIYKIYAVFN